ncbi:ABC transporter, substrate-binding protein (cluster 1, maltose/g3p/polyamine/iron) [Olavius sp. associated proteobacterium Delta 1]|nr:ABC transporter, substrate-binding protein (cluster 1, maltose/g3p/polyamine/iron) [Olavius sp. associated proteobacterium Delta 1]
MFGKIKTNLTTGHKMLFMGAVSALCVAVMGFGVPSAQAEGVLKVGAYGGYFKDSFDKHIFPDFTKETGIKIESVAEPTGEAWLVQLEQAARAGMAPADVSMMAQGPLLRGQRTELWMPLDIKLIPNAKFLLPQHVHKYPDGRVDGIGAVSWYITLVSNTDVFKAAPTSWADMWQADKKNKLGLLALASNSFLLEITAKTFFGGYDILNSKEGISKVLNKLAELKPNVKLWYRDEGQFQQALQSGEIPMGQYYHDVTGLAVADGHPVRSTFPKEGGVLDSGSWAVSKATKMSKEAHVFINYMCQPHIQKKLSLKVGTAPTVRREATGLTDAEFASVSSDISPIIPRYDLYTGDVADWVNQKWTEMVTE